MQKLNGIATSEGIAIAKALLFSDPNIDFNTIKTRNSCGFDQEYSNFLGAIDRVKASLAETLKRSEKILTANDREIFEAQIQMCEDPHLLELVKENLAKGEVATISVYKAGSQIADEFATIEDEYFQARVSDVKEIAKRICFELEGIKVRSLADISEDVIIVANDLTPSETVNLNPKFIRGFVTRIGGRTSHTAIVARSLGIPAILGVKGVLERIKDGDLIAINGQTGEVIVDPDQKTLEFLRAKKQSEEKEAERLKELLNKPSISKDGVRVELAVNIGSVLGAEQAAKLNFDAIGLVRSEFLYMSSNDWPTEEDQFRAYKQILEIAKGKKVVIRTLDIGGDKELSYHTFAKELNPFLGNRAIRLSRDNVEILKTQFRALIRASKFGKLSIMIPMISTVAEFMRAKKIFKDCCQEVKKTEEIDTDKIELGMMMETPAAAILADIFAEHADFFSIGSNDLIQYSMAADRMNEAVSYLYQPLNPSIIRFIEKIIKGGVEKKRWVGMCGEMGSDPLSFIVLVALGISEISMSPSVFLKNKAILADLDVKSLQAQLPKILNSKDENEVKQILSAFL